MKSTIKIKQGQLDLIIPTMIYDTNTCVTLTEYSLHRYVYVGSSGGEICLLAVSGDVGKEIIFTNATNNSVANSISGSRFYNFKFEGSGTEVNTFPPYSWARARVLEHSGTPYFFILESGINEIPEVGEGI